MTYQYSEMIYLLNMAFTVSYATAMFIYLGRHDTRASSTRALQRLLVGIMAWAFYDLLMAHIANITKPETAFFLFRFLSIIWIVQAGLAFEQIASLIWEVTNRHRLFFFSPFIILYLGHIFLPEYTSGRVYGIPGGWPGFPAPWQIVHTILWVGIFTILAFLLAFSVFRERDPKSKKEKIILLAGMIASMTALGFSRYLLRILPPGFPALGNTAMSFFILAAFIGLSRYGRVISMRTLYRVTVNSIPSGLAHVNRGRLTWANEIFMDIVGIRGKLVSDRDTGNENIQRIIEAGTTPLLEMRGCYYMVTVKPIDPDDPEEGQLFVLVDITDREIAAAEREQFIEQLEHLSNHDELTGMYNRRFFDNRLQEEWNRLVRSRLPLSLILLDIDHFKLYNDTYGHQAGDACLKSVAHVIRYNCKRAIDIAARYGGEEFAVIIPETGSEGAAVMAESIRRKIQDMSIPHGASPEKNVVTISAGVSAMVPSINRTFSEIIAEADAALYESKIGGRNRVTVRG